MAKDIIVKHIDTEKWIHKNSIEGKPFSFQELIVDPDTGMFVRYYRYNAGTMTPLHTHHCSHGMFILEGTLLTNKGNLGPGNFIWFEEGCEGYHGASEDGDVVCLFITNKPFDITFVDQK